MKRMHEIEFSLDLDSPTHYFGEPWEAGLFDEQTERVETPLGAKCWYCREEIEEEDQGTFIITAAISELPDVSPQHKECALRSVMGGYNCLLGKCNEPDHSPDPENLSKRAGALLVWELITTKGWDKLARKET